MPRFAANLSMMFNEVPFMERFVELSVDLVCQLPTRRFFRQYLVDSNLVVKVCFMIYQ